MFGVETWHTERLFYFLVEIFRMSEGPRAASKVCFATADGYAVVFGFFIPVCIPPVWVIVDPTTQKLEEGKPWHFIIFDHLLSKEKSNKYGKQTISLFYLFYSEDITSVLTCLWM